MGFRSLAIRLGDSDFCARYRGTPGLMGWLIGSPFAQKTPSPFTFLREFDGWEGVVDKLVECGDVEIEMDVLGRELQIFGAWEGAKVLSKQTQ